MKRNKPHYTPTPGYFFNSPFEERKTLGYLGNLIKSAFLNHKTSALFEFADSLLGQKPLVAAMKNVRPEFVFSEDFRRWVEGDSGLHGLSDRTKKTMLSRELSEAIKKKISALDGACETDLERRAKTIQTTFKLSAVEVEIMLFFFLKETVSVVDGAFSSDRNEIADFTSVPRFKNHGSALLGVNRRLFAEIFSTGNIFKTQVLEYCQGKTIALPSWCLEYLLGAGKKDLSTEYYCVNNDEPLDVADFDVTGDELSVLHTVLKSGASKNILFYGAPGTGKTSFARSLAKKYGKELLSVKTQGSGEHADRLRAIYATINRADKARSLVLVDEADELLNTFNSSMFRSVTQKSWINTILDTHGKKIIWITNRSEQVDPSTMRRFSFTLEFRKYDSAKRMKVLKYELNKSEGAIQLFSDKELKDLCQCHAVDAGGIVNAVRTVAINKAMKKDAANRQIRTILKNHEKATGGITGNAIRERMFDAYTLQGLNISVDPSGIIAGLKQYVESGVKTLYGVSLLLYGPPGTGKTEFVYYLGHTLKKEVFLKRASEIQSMYVGETEKNIAGAFADAGASRGILFFDEADSFLFPRKEAQRSWEKSFTNEILTQLENYRGIVIFATNDIEGLDHAALRRFRFKVRFDHLTPEGCLCLYNQLLKPLATDRQELTGEDIKRLTSVVNLTPGDFAVVKDQFAFTQCGEITHSGLINALIGETNHKKRLGVKIGF